MTPTPSKSLSVGRTITAAFRLYRDRFSPYFTIAVRASAWLLIPGIALLPILWFTLLDRVDPSILGLAIPVGMLLWFFGLAKYIANSALISRLAFGTLANQPETVQEASRQVVPRAWKFLWAYCLVFFIAAGAYLGLVIVFGFVAFIAAFIAVFIAQLIEGNLIVIGILVLLGAIIFAFGFIFFVRLGMRFFIIDALLAIESNLSASQAIRRSWKLTKGFAGRIFLILIVSFLITLPIQIIANIIFFSLQKVVIANTQGNPQSSEFVLFFFLIGNIISVAFGIAIVPFLQALKATIYYDLCSRKQGLDSNPRDRAIGS